MSLHSFVLVGIARQRESARRIFSGSGWPRDKRGCTRLQVDRSSLRDKLDLRQFRKERQGLQRNRRSLSVRKRRDAWAGYKKSLLAIGTIAANQAHGCAACARTYRNADL
ncbi:MAG TPA: hypothetical protein DEB40_08450 [Elusimicrobia bacterium]|nr:hypothetical protein [Elusimicrobiota bacterium]HBT61757.1 hypothetical protein [Elusimicrobiota bacterium]